MFVSASGQNLSGVKISDDDVIISSEGVDLDFDASDMSGFAYILVDSSSNSNTGMDLSASLSSLYNSLGSSIGSLSPVLGAVVFGLDGAVTITGTTDHDVLIGGDGDDIINGFGSGSIDTDLIIGGVGSNIVLLTAVTNRLKIVSVETVTSTDVNVASIIIENAISGVTFNLATSTADTLNLNGSTNSVTVSGPDTINLGNGGNTTTFINVQNINGGNAADTITVFGSATAVLNGGGGADNLTGGSGSDIFKYTASSELAVGSGDTINNFDATDDLEDILLVGLLTGTFTFLSAKSVAFSTGTTDTEVGSPGTELEFAL